MRILLALLVSAFVVVLSVEVGTSVKFCAEDKTTVDFFRRN